jgi:hypothetical protein
MTKRMTRNQNAIWLPIIKIWNIRAKWTPIRMYNKILKKCFKVNNFDLEIFLILRRCPYVDVMHLKHCSIHNLTKLRIFEIPILEHWIFWSIQCYFVCKLKVYNRGKK